VRRKEQLTLMAPLMPIATDDDNSPDRQDNLPRSEEERANNPDGFVDAFSDENDSPGRQDNLPGSRGQRKEQMTLTDPLTPTVMAMIKQAGKTVDQ
jgi:hypothetical protein